MEPWGHAFQVYGERGVSLSPILLGIATILEGKKKKTQSFPSKNPELWRGLDTCTQSEKIWIFRVE